MTEQHTQGRLRAGGSGLRTRDVWGINGYKVFEAFPGVPGDHIITVTELDAASANAAELVKRWNAFEPGGAVAQAIEALAMFPGGIGANAERRDFVATPEFVRALYTARIALAERTALRRAREEDKKEAAIACLVQAASVAVRVAQEEGQGAYQSTLDLADALQAARDAGLVKP